MPWLYYLSELDDTPNDILQDKSIDQIYTRESNLNLLAQQYSLEGKYLGLTTLADLPLTLCEIGENELKSALKYGNKYEKKVNLCVIVITERRKRACFNIGDISLF